MSRITVIGGTGYAGGHIATEAAARGHQVTALARTAPSSRTPGIEYRAADIRDDDALTQAIEGADAVIVALSPRGDMAGATRGAVKRVAEAAEAHGVRLGVIGGAGSLQVEPGGPALIETDAFPAEFKTEATEMAGALDDLRASDERLEWFYVSPAAAFGAWAPGERTGHYRLGGDVLLTDAEGTSDISGADFAIAVVDEIERPTHHRQRFTVAY